MSSAANVETTARRAANSKPVEYLARIGFVARGLMYLLVGLIAFQIGLGHGGQADRGGAMAQLAAKSYGPAILWALVVGFAGLALWRLSEAAFGAVGPDGHKASERLKSLARAVLYGFFSISTLRLVTGASAEATANSNSQSKELTARVMAHGGGRLLVGVIGLAIVAIGVMLAHESWTKEFLNRMNLAGASAGTRTVVEKLGLVGGIARGVVVVAAGVFLLIAAIQFSPSKAEGLDGTLRAFAHTPAGPALLILVALGLIAFGLFSWSEARWRRI